MLHIVTYFWGDKYSREYVQKLRAGVERNLKQPHKFVCITDKIAAPYDRVIPKEDRPLTTIKGCFARLRLFDPYFQFIRDMKKGDRIVCMDLDAVVTGPLDPLFDRPDPFVILGGANASNPCPYNGSLFLLRAGYRPDVWASFSLAAADKIKKHEFPDDQGWMWDRIPDASVWKAGEQSGVYGFQKPGWPKGSDDLPKGARYVAFFGSRDPAQFTHLKWVQEHWRL